MELIMLKVAKKLIGTLSVGNDKNDNCYINKDPSGFTLLELLLVIFFMGLIVGMATPFVMSTLDRIELQSSARQVASALNYARNKAITIKEPIIFNGDLTQNQFWLDSINGNKVNSVITLSSPIQIDHFIEVGGSETINNGKFSVSFFPQGNSSGGIIVIGIENTEETKNNYAINIDPITGKSKLIKGNE